MKNIKMMRAGGEESDKMRTITSLLEEIAMNREKVKYIKNTGKCTEREFDSQVEEQYYPNCHILMGNEGLFCSSCETKYVCGFWRLANAYNDIIGNCETDLQA